MSAAETSGLPIDLGPHWEVTSIAPGVFANRIQKHNTRTHAFQVIREETTSSFVLNLEPDGVATVCRGFRYLLSNDGPHVRTMEHLREQLGYRGRWAPKDAWVHLDLELDDSVCPRVGQYTRTIPEHADPWCLSCLPIAPGKGAKLTAPALACRPANTVPVFGEDEPHLVDDILPGRWIVLGAGNGLMIKVEPTLGRESPTARVGPSSEPVRIDSWKHPF